MIFNKCSLSYCFSVDQECCLAVVKNKCNYSKKQKKNTELERIRTRNGPGLFIKPTSQYVSAGTKEHNEKLQLVVSVCWISTGHFPQVRSITSWANFIFILLFCSMFVSFTSSLKILTLNAASHSRYLQNNSTESRCVGHVACVRTVCHNRL
jgi:hypothetical protein